MSELYGHQWISAQGVEPTERWVKALAYYDTQLTAKFISDCETGKHFVDYPPSVREFHIFCKPQNAAHKLFDFKQIEHKTGHVPLSRIQQMRNMSQAELDAIARGEA